MDTPTTPIANVTYIKKFFELNGGRKVSMEEMKALSAEDRAELGQLCKAEMEKK